MLGSLLVAAFLPMSLTDVTAQLAPPPVSPAESAPSPQVRPTHTNGVSPVCSEVHSITVSSAHRQAQ